MEPETRILSHIAILLLVSMVSGDYNEGSVYMIDNQPAIYKTGVLDKKAAAYGTYNDTLMTTGWGKLDICAGYGGNANNTQLMYAAGFLEGVFTAERIKNQYVNIYDFFFAGKSQTVLGKVRKFFDEQESWTRQNVAWYAEKDSVWRHAGYVLAQFDGLTDGFMSMADPKWNMDRFALQVLNANGDLLDLMHAVDPSNRPDFSKMTKPQLKQFVAKNGHCSALVKVMGAYEDLFMSHSSWFTYSATSRIYKHYDFNLDDPATAANALSFSSYPGYLESLDDFYLMNNGLVMLQTTNNVFNTSLYDLVTPTSLFAWQRVRMANHLAHSGKEWRDVFSKYNSGTYNNQYMIIDLNRIELGKDIHDDALWVVEQVPGLVVGADKTEMLRAGYWPSYNVPFFESIYNVSGYPAVVSARGVDFSYQLAPRAKIFRRDQDTVLDMNTMKHIMRYNDYEHDKYSEGNPCDTICCRGDLDPRDPSPMGCYDTKVANYKMALKRQAFVMNGPTLGDDLPPFKWTGSFANMSHVGLPDVYNFGWEFVEPKLV